MLIAREAAPFFTPGLIQLKPRIDPSVESGGVPTMSVDKYWNLYVHPDLPFNHDVLADFLLHEVAHLIKEHHARYEAYCHKVDIPHAMWNIAADMDNNSTVWEFRGRQLETPSYIDDNGTKRYFGVHPQLYIPGAPLKVGESAEFYANELVKRMTMIKVSILDIGGSCSDGQQRPWETAPKHIDNDKPILEAIATEIQLYASKMGSCVAEQLLKWANKYKGVTINPFSILHTMITTSTNNAMERRSSWRSTRVRNGFISPRFSKAGVNLGVVVDTSGSMHSGGVAGSALEGAMANLLSIMHACGGLTVFWCDSGVQSQRVYRPEDLRPVGGGGTDMGVGIKAAKEANMDSVIVVTDGETPWPADPGIPVIVVLLRAGGVPTVIPDYAQGICIDLNELK